MAEPNERELRVDLACALRWAARYGLHEGICNHFSVRLPGDEGTTLTLPAETRGEGELRLAARGADGQVRTAAGPSAPRTRGCGRPPATGR